MIAGIVEKKRFEPFYTPIECTHPAFALRMSTVSFPPGNPFGVPAGAAPYGLYGSMANTTATCDNPNQISITTKKEDSVTYMYLPNLTNPIDGTPYLEIGKSFLTHDFSLQDKRTTELKSEAFGSLPLAAFAALGAAASLHGFVPLYTKTIATAETCLTLFGITICDKGTEETWCGNLGGNCFVDLPAVPGMVEPAICPYTRTVCRLTEAEMKALVTPANLGLAIVATIPCPVATGLANMMCNVASAVGVEDVTAKMLPIPGFVDGPFPRKDDLDKGSASIELFTTLAIVSGVVLTVFCWVLAAAIVLKSKRTKGHGNASPNPAAPHPTILTAPVAGQVAIGGIKTDSVCEV